jgi:hypothetical protein
MFRPGAAGSVSFDTPTATLAGRIRLDRVAVLHPGVSTVRGVSEGVAPIATLCPLCNLTFIIGSGFVRAQSRDLQICALRPVNSRTNEGLIVSSGRVRSRG